MSFELVLALGIGAFSGGFVSGFAGFGTALVVSGLWFATLPASLVPPLIILSAFSAQCVGLFRLKSTLSLKPLRRLLVMGAIGVPIGTYLVVFLDEPTLKMAVGGFLVLYSLLQIVSGPRLQRIRDPHGWGEAAVGLTGGLLGGLAGLAGPIPIIWYQLRGFTAQEQRARYQPFNLVILGIAALSMCVIGQITAQVLTLFTIAFPITTLGTILGLYLYQDASEQLFRYAVLRLLCASGAIILVQALGLF